MERRRVRKRTWLVEFVEFPQTVDQLGAPVWTFVVVAFFSCRSNLEGLYTVINCFTRSLEVYIEKFPGEFWERWQLFKISQTFIL